MNYKSFSILMLLMIFVHFTANGQMTETSDLTSASLLESSTMTINGSSTLHKWEVVATEFSVNFQIPEIWFDSDNHWTGTEIADLTVAVPVEHLDGGRKKMNRDLREALKFIDYPEIRFQWDNITFRGDGDVGKIAEVSGRVMIAGKEREIQFSANLGLNEWSQIVAKGSVPINMRDYNIDPPTALFGVIRTEEEIALVFDLYFKEKEE